MKLLLSILLCLLLATPAYAQTNAPNFGLEQGLVLFTLLVVTGTGIYVVVTCANKVQTVHGWYDVELLKSYDKENFYVVATTNVYLTGIPIEIFREKIESDNTGAWYKARAF